MTSPGQFDKATLQECVGDALALLTASLHDERDQAMLVEALGVVSMRDEEDFTAWIVRVAHLVLAETALLNGVTDALARRVEAEPIVIVRGIAIRHAARQTGDGQ